MGKMSSSLLGMKLPSLTWIRGQKWKLLLSGMALLLLVSPIPEVYDQQDNLISPLAAIIFLAVILGTAEKRQTIWLLTGLNLVWLGISIGDGRERAIRRAEPGGAPALYGAAHGHFWSPGALAGAGGRF